MGGTWRRCIIHCPYAWNAAAAMIFRRRGAMQISEQRCSITACQYATQHSQLCCHCSTVPPYTTSACLLHPTILPPPTLHSSLTAHALYKALPPSHYIQPPTLSALVSHSPDPIALLPSHCTQPLTPSTHLAHATSYHIMPASTLTLFADLSNLAARRGDL